MKLIYPFLIFTCFLFQNDLYAQTGCMDPEAWNYDPDAIQDSGNCVYVSECGENETWTGFTAYGLPLIGSTFYVLNASLQDTIFSDTFTADPYYFGGCLNVDSCYAIKFASDAPNSTAHIFVYDEVPIYIQNGVPDQIVSSSQNWLQGFSLSGTDCGSYGCTDETALNYSPDATINYGCIYCQENNVRISTSGPLSLFGDSEWSIESNGISIANGNFSSSQGVSEIYECIPDGCYELVLFGDRGYKFNKVYLEYPIGDTLAAGFLSQEGEVRIPFGINAADCADPDVVYGCTNPLGINYNPAATVDDGSCDLINDECSIEFDIVQDSLTDAISFHANIYSSDYPIYIFYDFGDGSDVLEEFYPSHTFNGDGPFEVCISLYTFSFFSIEPLCYDIFCGEFDPMVYGISPGEEVVVDMVQLVNSIDERIGSKQISIYPNPAGEQLKVTTLMSTENFEEVRIYNLQGRLIKELPAFSNSPGEYVIDISDITAGAYLLLLKGSDSYAVKRFVKQ